MKLLWLGFLSASVASAHLGMFSIHEDLLSYPQFEVVLSDSYVLKSDADALLGLDATDDATSDDKDRSLAVYEQMKYGYVSYLCEIPTAVIQLETNNASSLSPEEEQKELVRATLRGWELLKDMEGSCLYFLSGWWSYSFCYNKDITQFHQLASGTNGIRPYPPIRDPTTPSFILGKFDASYNQPPPLTPSEDYPTIESSSSSPTIQGPRSSSQSNTLSVRSKGDNKYLSLVLDSGTICDLTDQPRKVEIQFHCQPNGPDRIGWIKETTTCAYVMVIYTPRLCNDVAFVPPREDQPEQILCKEIVRDGGPSLEEWSRRTLEGKSSLRIRGPNIGVGSKSEKIADQRIIIGDIEVGAQKLVGADGNKISLRSPRPAQGETSGDSHAEVVAKNAGRGSPSLKLADDELRRRGMDPELINEWIREMEKDAGDKEWRLEVEEDADGELVVKGLIGGPSQEEDDAKDGEAAGKKDEIPKEAMADSHDASETGNEGDKKQEEERHDEL